SRSPSASSASAAGSSGAADPRPARLRPVVGHHGGMTVLAWTLLALGVLVLVLTQVRLRRYRGQQGMTDIAPWILNVHTTAGLVALVLVVLRLLDVHSSSAATWVALLAMVLTAVIGLSLLARWTSSGGRHTAEVEGDGWTSGPWLSQLAHIGYALGTVFFVWALLGDRI